MKIKPLIKAALLSSTVLFCFSAQAEPLFDNLFFFGDSLSDIGNAQNPAPSGQAAPVSNGPNLWSAALTSKFNFTLTTSNSGGNDFALAGDQTGAGINTNSSTFFNPVITGGILGGWFSNPFTGQNQYYPGQLQQFLSLHPILDPHGLYSIWAGANDLFVGAELAKLFSDPSIGIAYAQQAVKNLATIVTILHNAGARYILLLNLPDLGNTPQFNSDPTDAASINELTIFFNNLLASHINTVGFDVIQLDIQTLFRDILADPSRFGFTNTTGELQNCPTCNPNQYLFWNAIHPTNAGHALIADYAFEVLTGPTYAAQLAEAPISVMNTQNNNIESTLYTIHTQPCTLPVHQWNVFGDVNYLTTQIGTRGSTPGFSIAGAPSFSAGGIYRFNNDLLLGAAINRAVAPVNFPHGAGGFNMTESLVSALGSFEKGRAYIDALINAGFLNYGNFERNFMMGIAPIIATGGTNGTDLGVELTAGYQIVDTCHFHTGPLINMSYQTIHVDPFQENNDLPGSTLNFWSQINTSFITGAGWQEQYTFDINNVPISPFVQITFNREWKDGDRQMEAGVVSLPGSRYTIPVEGLTGNFGLANAGITINVLRNLAFTANYQVTLSRVAGRIQNISLGFLWNV